MLYIFSLKIQDPNNKLLILSQKLSINFNKELLVDEENKKELLAKCLGKYHLLLILVNKLFLLLNLEFKFYIVKFDHLVHLPMILFI